MFDARVAFCAKWVAAHFFSRLIGLSGGTGEWGGLGAREIEALALALAEEAALPLGLVVVDVAYVRESGQRVLRAVVDRPEGGVTLAELERFSRAFEVLLDRRDPIAGPYRLEAASPGVGRGLRRERDFDVFRGRRVRLVTYPPERREVMGVLLGLSDGVVRVRADDGEEVALPRERLARANLADGEA